MQYCNTCGSKAKRIEFNTFAYDYCEKCKTEVEHVTEELVNDLFDYLYPNDRVFSLEEVPELKGRLLLNPVTGRFEEDK